MTFRKPGKLELAVGGLGALIGGLIVAGAVGWMINDMAQSSFQGLSTRWEPKVPAPAANVPTENANAQGYFKYQ